jgi:hypothetical protein
MSEPARDQGPGVAGRPPVTGAILGGWFVLAPGIAAAGWFVVRGSPAAGAPTATSR